MNRQQFDKGSSIHRVACPHLGSTEDRNALRDEPSASHRCFAYAQVEMVSMRQQEQCCLRVHWTRCYKLQPGYQPMSTGEPTHGATVENPTGSGAEDETLQTARVSLAAKRLLSGSVGHQSGEAGPHDSGEAGVAVDAEKPAPSAGGQAQPQPEPAADDAPSTDWQIPLLWLSVTLPALLLLATVGLIGAVALDSSEVAAKVEWPVVKKAEEPEPLPAIEINMVAPTPVPTFAPVTEDPERPYVAPAVPSPPPLITEGLPDLGSWPKEPADGPPDRIWAPQVGVDTSIIPVGSYIKEVNGQRIRFYQVAEYAAGWHKNSSLPGQKGNLVVAGHNTVKGGVFRHVGDLEPGHVVLLEANGRTYPYVVATKEIVAEAIASDEQRADNGRWIAQSEDERLTLITCWPPGSNSHRAIVVARPLR